MTTVDAHELEPNRVELVYTVVGGIPRPSYVKGILKVGMELVGARDVEVTWAPDQQPGSLKFLVTWSAKR